jgi:hypothetical protein
MLFLYHSLLDTFVLILEMILLERDKNELSPIECEFRDFLAKLPPKTRGVRAKQKIN